MSEVYEVTPDRCPACHVSWQAPGTMRPGWGQHPTGIMGRTWWCTTCDAIIPAVPELRPLR